MALEKLQGVELPAAADMHVHLRHGEMSELVVLVTKAPIPDPHTDTLQAYYPRKLMPLTVRLLRVIWLI